MTALQDEIEVLISIYPELKAIQAGKDTRLTIPVNIELHQSRDILVHEATNDNTLSDTTSSLKVDHLPPIHLDLQLPEGYPYDSPPNVKLRSSWLLDSQDWLDDVTAQLADRMSFRRYALQRY